MSVKSRQAKWLRRLKRRYPPYLISWDRSIKPKQLSEYEFDALYPQTETARKEFLKELLRIQMEQLHQMALEWMHRGSK